MATSSPVRRLHQSRLDDLAHALRELHAAFGVRSRQDEREFLAAPARGHVAVADSRPQRVRELLQQLVAEGVAVTGR